MSMSDPLVPAVPKCVFASIEGVASCATHREALLHTATEWKCPSTGEMFPFGASFGSRSLGVPAVPVAEQVRDRLMRLMRDIGTVREVAGRRSDKQADRDHMQMLARLDRWREEVWALHEAITPAPLPAVPEPTGNNFPDALKQAVRAARREREPDVVCEHGTAMDVHCCNCHSGFIFDFSHECPAVELEPPTAQKEPHCEEGCTVRWCPRCGRGIPVLLFL